MNVRENFLRYAMSAYDNPHSHTIEEFNLDLKKFRMLKRNIKRESLSDLHSHVLLNQVLTLYNVFTCIECTKMMFYVVPKEHWYRLKTICLYLHTMPENVPELGLVSGDIPVCMNLAKILRNL